MQKVVRKQGLGTDTGGGPIARRVEVNGIVQGVGFRPFVYRLANRYKLNGVSVVLGSGGAARAVVDALAAFGRC